MKNNTQSSIKASRKVILLELFWTRDKDPRVPLGHASLLASLQQVEGLEIAGLTHAVNNNPPAVDALCQEILDLAKAWPSSKIDLAIGCYVWAEDSLQRLLPALRDRGFEGRIILGGPQISYSESGLESIYPEADLFVRGYGESALKQLCSGTKAHLLPGVHIAGEKDLELQCQISLDSLPSPWLTGLIPLSGQSFIRWETQRGCPFRCAFCQHKEAGARLKNRKLNPGRIRDEIELFCRSGVKEIAVLDPIFNTTADAAAILRSFKAQGYRGKLSLQCRLELITPEFLEACEGLDITLEFGLQTTHQAEMKAIKRNNNLKKADWALQYVRSLGIPHEVSLIFGLPEQTLQSFIDSVNWCLTRQVPVLKAFPLMLLRGTGLHLERQKWGLREDGASMPCVIESDTFSEQDWYKMQAISNALKHSEGCHPPRISLDTAEHLKERPTLNRWRPARPPEPTPL